MLFPVEYNIHPLLTDNVFKPDEFHEFIQICTKTTSKELTICYLPSTENYPTMSQLASLQLDYFPWSPQINFLPNPNQ